MKPGILGVLLGFFSITVFFLVFIGSCKSSPKTENGTEGKTASLSPEKNSSGKPISPDKSGDQFTKLEENKSWVNKPDQGAPEKQAPVSDDPGNPVLAEFGSVKITLNQVKEVAAKRNGFKILEELVNQEIVSEQVRAYGVQVFKEEVEKRLGDILEELKARNKQRFGEEVTLEGYLEANGYTLASLKAELLPKIRRQIEMEYLVRFQYETNDIFDVSLIFLKDRNQALKTKQKLDAGANFDKIAGESSMHPSKDKGGRLGYILRGSFPNNPTFENVIFNLAPGTHSDIVEQPDGYYLFRLNDFKKGNPNQKFAEKQKELAVLLKEKPVSEEEILSWLIRVRAQRGVKLNQPEILKFDRPNPVVEK